jgi:SH3 domain protein
MAVLLLSCLNAHAQSEENSKTLVKLQADNQRLQAELANMKTAKESAEKTNQQLDAEIARLNSEVIAIRQASASILQIQNERDALTEEKRKLVSELEMLKREKIAQDISNKQNWFMIGAGVLFGGIFLGVILPRLSWRKKNSWESF